MFQFLIDPVSFFIGFVTASIFWLLVSRARPLLAEMRTNWKERQEEAKTRRSSSVEENFRRTTLRRAQGMHLASQLFALDEIIQEPRLIAPPLPVVPGSPPQFEDIISQTLPYLPAWPEIAAVYQPQTLTLPQALMGNANIVIIGQPGVGKTVSLAHLASLAANRSEKLGALKDFIPVLVHVADLKLSVSDPKNTLNPLIEAASEHAPIFDLGKLPDLIKNAFKNGKALLLVDGYDEIPPENQQSVSEYLRMVIQEYPQVRIVTTGAPEHLDGLIALGFAPLTLCAWSARQNKTFIEHWGLLWSQTVGLEAPVQGAADPVDSLLLNSWLGADHLNLSPLELTLKAWGAYAGDSLGPQVMDAIATHIRRIAPANTPLAALETLAMQAMLSSQPVFDPREARGWVKSFDIPDEEEAVEESVTEPPAEESSSDTKPKKRRKAEKVATPTPGLLGKMASSGLLNPHPNNKMRFVHIVFSGYLAGRALANFSAEETLLNQSDWSGKYLTMHYFAAHGDADRLVQSLMEFSRLPVHRALFAAARWLRDAPRNAPWRGRLFGLLAEVLQMEGTPLSLRGQAMAAFAVSGDPNAAVLFRQLAGTLSFELVQLCALGAGAMRDAKSIPALATAVQAPSLSVRSAACLALVAIGTNEAMDIVAQTLLTGDEEIRRAAGEALANDPNEGHAMLRDGITMEDVLLRRAVMYGLGRVEETWAIEILEKARVNDKEWIVRNAAAEVLDAKANVAQRAPNKLKVPSESPWLIEFAGKQGMGISPGVPATDILLLALKSDEAEYRLASLPYLKFTPNEGVLTQLYDAMYKDDTELREAAYQTLWELGTAGTKLPNPIQYGFK
jgi:hypothetical protein